MIDWNKLNRRDIKNVLFAIENEEEVSEEVKETIDNSISRFLEWLHDLEDED